LPVITTAPSSTTTVVRWKRLTDMPTVRSGLAVAVYENIIYAIGGETLQSVTGVVESYNPETNSWQKKSPMPLAVADVSAAVIGGRIYVPGGRLASGKVTNILEVYDPRQDHWAQGAILPIAISAYAMVAFEGKLYLFGGWDGNQYRDSVFVYDPSRDAWSTRTHMPTIRGFAGAAVIGEKIFVVGGYNGTTALAVSEVYYPDRDESTDIPWDKVENLPEGRYAMGSSSLTDVIYLVGGKGDTKATLSPLLYNPQVNSWETFEMPPLHIGDSLGLVSLGNYLYAIGGRSTQETTNYTLSYQAIYTILIPFAP
jgi:Kelch motif